MFANGTTCAGGSISQLLAGKPGLQPAEDALHIVCGTGVFQPKETCHQALQGCERRLTESPFFDKQIAHLGPIANEPLGRWFDEFGDLDHRGPASPPVVEHQRKRWWEGLALGQLPGLYQVLIQQTDIDQETDGHEVVNL
jgi:hypothetical protein